MPLAFSASQRLDLPVSGQAERLPEYLEHEDRVIAALLDARQLTPLTQGTYRYTVTTLQVFQLQVKPVVSLEIQTNEGTSPAWRDAMAALKRLPTTMRAASAIQTGSRPASCTEVA